MSSGQSLLGLFGITFYVYCSFLTIVLGRHGTHNKIKLQHDDRGHRGRTYRHLDLDYDRLLRSFGVSSNISDGDGPGIAAGLVDVVTNATDESWRETILGNKTRQLPTNDCDSLQCDHGRICRVSISTGNAECVCRPHCPAAHRNPVCGSDGNWYQSHCELHRISCLESRPLHVVLDSRKTHCPASSYLTTSTSPTTVTVNTGEDCSMRNYGILKEKLLLHFYNRFAEGEDEKPSLDKRKLVHSILTDFDRDNNEQLDQKELDVHQLNLLHLSDQCNLNEILRNEDLNQDGLLDIHELSAAYGLPMLPDLSVANPVLTHFQHTVVAGNSIEIPCHPHQIPSSITWERNQVKLNGLDEETGLRINDQTGTLYVTHAQLIHAGNYSCFDGRGGTDTAATVVPAVTHALHVLLLPEVETETRQIFGRPHDNATLKCHAVGVPSPNVKWLKNEEPIEHSDAILSGQASRLILSSLLYKDTGVYSCNAQNEAGTSSAISSVFVVDQDSREKPYRKLFAVFFAKGITVYEPLHCRAKFHISNTDKVPGSADLVCGMNNHGCDWGSVVNVMDRYLYASQPLLNRILVISLDQMAVVQVINTDRVPVKLQYVPHFDQLWILCWTRVGDNPTKTIQVIRDASVKVIHAVIHPEPIDGKYQTVADLFIPPVQELAHKFAHAYAVCSSQTALRKLDMRNLKFIRTVDLLKYGCRPRKISYSSVGGLVFVDCNDAQRGTPKGQIVLDYLTDAVLYHDETTNGITFISPDSRYWVNLGTDIIRMQRITETGLVYLYDITSTFHIADITFHPSQSSHFYDLYATGLTKDHLLHVELENNRLSTISGIGFGSGRKTNPWGNGDSRFLAHTGLFGSYLVSAAKSSAFVTDTNTQTVNCAIGDLPQPQHGIWFYRSFH